MNDKLKAKLLFEISQIDKLLDDSQPLFDLCKIKKPDFIEMSAASMVLHSFCNGIENILVLIFTHYHEELPNDNKWHTKLLAKAFIPNENRKQIFQNESREMLEEYLKFRHFVRHAYGFQLEWARMENLINGITTFWQAIKKNVNEFIKNN